MNVLKHPKPAQLALALQRPATDLSATLSSVTAIIEDVKTNGDKALIKYAQKFDGAKLKTLRVTDKEIAAAVKQVDDKLKKAIKTAYDNIRKFHKAQRLKTEVIETTKGVVCWRESRAIENVGLYIPGGSAPLFSTVLMLAIPAAIAGCKRIVLCSPTGKDGNIHPATLFAAQLCGVHEVYKAGGAQAIAAMAYGTGSIKKVDKLFGPGNRFVTAAKQLVQQHGVAIDMPAGPSEVMVVGDDTCIPQFVAADLLSQAEHGADSQVLFVTWKESVIKEVIAAVEEQTALLPRREVATAALKNSKIILVKDKSEALNIINAYAPEHLILAVKNEDYFIKNVYNAGSVFIGNYTPESAGDYASGTNHTLPTNGYARVYAGVSLDAFVKKITYQKISPAGLKNLGPVIETMAEAEELQAHKNAVSIRLKELKGGKK